MSNIPSNASRIRGCLFGGAVGDALGAPIEFASWPEIRSRHGDHGLTEVLAPGHFTDDTQMTLFTCEGLIAAALNNGDLDIDDVATMVYRSYLHWMVTQGYKWENVAQVRSETTLGWLVKEERLHRREAPGNTCLSALASGAIGSKEIRLNSSKGCGGVMRAAPAGIIRGFIPFGAQPEYSYELGCSVAAITHGHDLGIHSAGLLAAIVCCIMGGLSVAQAVETSLAYTTPELRALASDALRLGQEGTPSPEVIEHELGSGWVGEEAIAIAIACSVGAVDFETGVLASVNHSGDSDSTGSICGNILGAAFGEESIPHRWFEAVDAIDLVEQVADDCVMWVTKFPSTREENHSTFNRLVEWYAS